MPVQSGCSGHTKLARTCAVWIVLVCAGLMLTAASARADSDGDTDAYSLRISPATVSGGSSSDLTFVLTNHSSPGSPLRSANINAPPGFKPVRASLPPGASGTARVVGNLVELRSLALASGETVRVTVTASAPDKCRALTYTWGSAARENSDFTGERLRLIRSRSQLTTTTTSACALVFATQPHSAVVGQHITGVDYDPSGPPVTVEVVNAQGSVVRAANATITMRLASNPGNAVLAGVTTVVARDGVASFHDLTLDKPGLDYTLTASSQKATSATSKPFDISNAAAICLQNTSCQTSVSSDVSTLQVTANPNPTEANAGILTETLDVGKPLQCQSYSLIDPNWYGFAMTSIDRSKVLNYTIDRASGDAIWRLQFCLGAPYEFKTLSGAPASPGTLPDGTSGFIGLLPRCRQWWDGSEHSSWPSKPRGPCVASRKVSTTGGGVFSVTLTIDIPSGLPGDPWGRA